MIDRADSTKLRKLSLLEEKKKLKDGLPHLYSFPFYKWSRSFFETRNHAAFMCSANQISKSSTQIRKTIHWATCPRLWPELWPNLTPRQFWYLYPSAYVATVEFEKKWIPEFMPRNEYKTHPIYGWTSVYRARYIQAVHFNSGVSIYFKTYSQDAQDLQSGSVSYIAFDEELPEELIPELQARLFATDGYLSGVFTPTLGQEFWREAMEEKGKRERFKEAFKLQVSMYDCLEYEDGTPSFWTKERIEKIKAGCKSEAEIQRRVYGRFVSDSGLKYPAFNPGTNIIEPVVVPSDWPVFVGVDSGSGGKHNHPAAVAFIAIRPDFRLGYVFKGRRFDDIETTADDLVQYVSEMLRDVKNPIYGIFYDFAAVDLRQITSRMGSSWMPAEKSHAIGEQVINVGFKNHMLMIFGIPELDGLVSELKSLKHSTSKIMAKDDFIDAMRYGVVKVPWDWSAINEVLPAAPKPKTEIDLRREFVSSDNNPEFTDDIDREIEEYNDLLENY